MTDTHIAEIRARWAGVDPWYPRATDDDMFMNARYVCTEPGPTNAYGEWKHDNKRGMGLSDEQQDSGKVIAITLLQFPRLADHDDHDENTERIAAAPTDIAALLAALDAVTAEMEGMLQNSVGLDDAFMAGVEAGLSAEEDKLTAERDAAQADLAALRSIVATRDTCFGAPRFDDTRLPIECVALQVEAGVSAEEVAEDYEISAAQVRAAVHWWQAVGKELAGVWKAQNGRVDALQRRCARIAAERDAAQARVRELEREGDNNA